jgi:hypothetical protein
MPQKLFLKTNWIAEGGQGVHCNNQEGKILLSIRMDFWDGNLVRTATGGDQQ